VMSVQVHQTVAGDSSQRRGGKVPFHGALPRTGVLPVTRSRHRPAVVCLPMMRSGLVEQSSLERTASLRTLKPFESKQQRCSRGDHKKKWCVLFESIDTV
jgi:hypothetical protein